MDETTIVGILAGLLGLLIGGGVVGWTCWYWSRIRTQVRQEARARHAAELESLEKQQADVLRHLRQAHRAELRQLREAGARECDNTRRELWFDTLRKVPWRADAPEVEVESKFVFRLLQFLGYEEEDMELRTSLPVQEGSRQTTLHADWVVRDGLGQALMVVEVKAPDAPVDHAVQEQARSYAFRLGAPVYAITNGRELQIYHLGVVEDNLALSCRTSELRDNWDTLEKVASEANVTTLRWALGHN
jgi:hypothetical protein